jgi:diguanylate cyclase (GGDEF)-like protein
MDSEKMLLALYKKHEYELTQRKTQQMVFAVAISTVLLSIAVALMIKNTPVLLYGLIGALGIIVVCYLLQLFKVLSLNTASILYFSYFYFVFLPIYWYSTNGVSDTAPYISFVFPLVIFLVFADKARVRIQIGLMAVVIGMSAYSVATAPADAVSDVLYKVIVYTVMMFLMNFYLIYLQRKYEKMHDQFLTGSIKDDLTRVFSRGVIDVILDYVESLYKSKGIDYVIIMVDLDNFKKLNDEYGHVMGDVVLRNTADCIKQNMREDDFVIRYGGDEFVVVLMNTTIESAAAIFNRIESAANCQQLLELKAAVSRGYALRSECKNPQDVLILADQRMYENKKVGK